MQITLYHNPNCGTSRNVLEFIREAGIEPLVIEYLKNPPSVDTLKELVSKMGIPLKSLVRVKNNEENIIVKALETYDDAQLYEALVNNPILINRPIVVMGDVVKLCRPSETVKSLLNDINNG